MLCHYINCYPLPSDNEVLVVLNLLTTVEVIGVSYVYVKFRQPQCRKLLVPSANASWIKMHCDTLTAVVLKKSMTASSFLPFFSRFRATRLEFLLSSVLLIHRPSLNPVQKEWRLIYKLWLNTTRHSLNSAL